MKRGEVWWINFEPSVGGEIKKERPAVIISNDASNQMLNRLQVVPITSNVSRVFPCEALVEVNSQSRKAMADQLTTVSKHRVRNRIGELSAEDVAKVETAIRVQLGLTQ
jgi:mRNA interferase MazF